MFLASDVIKRHFGAHTESQESYSLPVAKHFLGLCLAKRRLYFGNCSLLNIISLYQTFAQKKVELTKVRKLRMYRLLYKYSFQNYDKQKIRSF